MNDDCTIPMTRPTATVTPMLRKRPTRAAPSAGMRKMKVNVVASSCSIGDARIATSPVMTVATM